MDINYTPQDISMLKKKYAVKSQSAVLFIIIAVLTVTVLGLFVYILLNE